MTADAVLAPLHSEADFAKYKGKLKGKIVLIFDPRELEMHTEAEAKRLTDAEVMARTITNDVSRPGGFGGARPGAAAPRPGDITPTTTSTAAATGMVLRNKINKFLKDEGAAVAITPGYNGDGGTVFASYGGSQNPNDPVGPPMALELINENEATFGPSIDQSYIDEHYGNDIADRFRVDTDVA